MTKVWDTSNPSCTTGNSLANYTYDALSRRTNVAHLATSSSAYTYNLAGDLLTLTNAMTSPSVGNTATLIYTPAHQLTSEGNDNTAWNWSYPATGTTAYGASANGLNQYKNVGGHADHGQDCAGNVQAYSYDCGGNLTGDAIWTFAYDIDNRMSSAAMTGTTASYLYDPKGRRVQRTVNSTTITTFLHDGDSEIAEYDGSGALTQRYIPGPAVDDIVAREAANGTHSYPLSDHHGSVVAVAHNDGSEVGTPNTYDGYGNTTTGNGFAFGYTGQRYDTATGLYYYRARMYSPSLGRFLQTDPIGYGDDLNWYAYVGNDPTNRTDSTGHAPIGWIVKLTEKGLVLLKPLGDKAAAVAARKAEKNVYMTKGRQAAGSVERAQAGDATKVSRDPAHDLGDGDKGSPHFQTEGQRGHTFYDVGGAVIGGALAALELIDEVLDQTDPTSVTETGCDSWTCMRTRGESTPPGTGAPTTVSNGLSPEPRPGVGGQGQGFNTPSSNSKSGEQHVCTGSLIPTAGPCTSF